MAQQVQIVLIDDIDGGSADETVNFALDGVSYQIDLSSANAARMRQTISEFVGHARKAGRPGGRRSAKAGQSQDSAAIRTWAKSRGISVNQRGRIPAELVAKYEASRASGS